MPKINVLPKYIANLIAAGEVVERPASVVKELLENSIDAKSTNITVEIKRGGITYIRITDNGCGIEREDVHNAFKSHATSKILDPTDLNSIITLGFRGEALASIAAVSKTEILTRTEDEDIGTRCVVEGSEEVLVDDAGCPQGTTIVVKDLFYNTPARMKFLKKDVTEGNAVSAVVDRLALSHPEISFRFIRDGKIVLITQGKNELYSTIYSVFGKDFAKGLVSTEYELESIKVEGYISKPLVSRANRSMQFFFLNGRLVKSQTAMAALEQAYKNSIMVGKFPSCVLNIEAPYESVDVNVHPTKMQVRFENEKRIFNAVYYATKSALEEKDTPAQVDLTKLQINHTNQFYKNEKPEQMTMKKSNDFWQNKSSKELFKKQEEAKKELYNTLNYNQTDKAVAKAKTPQSDYKKVDIEVSTDNEIKNKEVENNKTYQPVQEVKVQPTQTETLKVEEPDVQQISKQSVIENIDIEKPEEQTKGYNQEVEDISNSSEAFEETQIQENKHEVEEIVEEEIQFRVIGEAFKTYIIVELDKKLVIIDKHAAHERMIFETLKQNIQQSNTQILLAPVTITLSKEEYSVLIENKELLSKAGFEIEDFGIGTIIVRECPIDLSSEDVKQMIEELAGYLLSSREPVLEKIDWIYHSTACRAAIKAGDKTSTYELIRFVKKLLSNPSIRYCPHGRPVYIEMTKNELEKQFGRI